MICESREVNRSDSRVIWLLICCDSVRHLWVILWITPNLVFDVLIPHNKVADGRKVRDY